MTPVKWATIPIPRAVGLDQQLDRLDILYGKKLFVGRLLKEGGLCTWQAPTTASLLAAWDVTSSSVFFDVGANIGIYAALHARLRPEATAIAFEPTPDVADSGESIAAANDLDIRWERVAVSDAEGEATLFLSGRTDASNSLVSGYRQPKGTVSVPTVTLDGFVGSSGLIPEVIKIDVERHEPAVIRGAAELLNTHHPIVVAELLPGRPESDEIQQLLADHGYHARHIEPPASHSAPDSDGPLYDWLFWPGEVPTTFDDRFVEWYAAVARCGPVEAHSA